MSKRDYYEVLGLSKSSGQDEIKKAYRKIALQYHPDRNGTPEAEEKFKEASEAYEVLSNEEKKSVYDRFGHAGISGQGYQGFNDVGDIFDSFGNIFEEFFGFGGGGGGGRKRTRRGADLKYPLRISFEEAVFGVEKQIQYERREACKPCDGSGAAPGSKPVSCKTCGGIGQVRRSQGFFSIQTPCPHCAGQGQVIDKPCKTCSGEGMTRGKKQISVKIPPGIDSGVRLRVNGEGEGSPGGGQNGDLYVVIEVEESDRFVRDEFDLILEQPITMIQAAIGAKIVVKTLKGEKELEIPAGTQYGDKKTLVGEGIPHLRGVGKGDLHVVFNVQVPKKLTKEQRQILEQYAELEGESNSQQGGFFNRLFKD
ncbi:MAG: molecular chaperone DnaJ [Oligoflexales bacterium]|nr:molecular chaperone DnaJ [Oligoflexales bacterium]